MRRIEIAEGSSGNVIHGLTVEQAAILARLSIGSVAPLASGEWRVSGIRKVGVLRLGELELRIHPKTAIDRLFYLLSRGQQWGDWYDESVSLNTDSDLYPAVAEVFGRWCDRILRAGVLRGYRTRRSSEPYIRGRWMVTEQMSRRFGMPLPAELMYDEFTVDIPENQLVRSAARRLLSFESLPREVATRLHRADRSLADASLLTVGNTLPQVRFDRRNERYRPLLAVARMILANDSLEYSAGLSPAFGFLLNLATVFEEYIEAEVTRLAAPFGGAIEAQHVSSLDRAGYVTIKPDLVWLVGGRVRAVFDAKYKVIHDDAYPNADVYQMLAYCVRHGVPEGHLIYADGHDVPTQIVIAGGDGVRIFGHAVDLSKPPSAIEAQLRAIVTEALGGASRART